MAQQDRRGPHQMESKLVLPIYQDQGHTTEDYRTLCDYL